MHDLARVLFRTGKRDEALGVYRALVPRIELLATSDRRVSVLLEGAHLSMAAEGAGGAPLAVSDLGKPRSTMGAPQTPPAPPRPKLDEAIAYLREARQRPPTALAGEVLLSLALALDRAGAHEEADATVAEAGRSGARLRSGPLDYLGAPEDRAALEALAAEGSEEARIGAARAPGGAAVQSPRIVAQKAWESYLAGPGGKGAWAAAARGRLDALRKGGARPTKTTPVRGRRTR
jgi:hypothetical protein